MSDGPNLWKWGCLGFGALMFCGFGGCLLGIVGVGKFALDSSPVREEALEMIKSDPDVVAALGDDISSTAPSSIRAHISNGRGEMQWSQPVRGTKGRGKLKGLAIKENDKWRITRLSLQVGEKTIPVIGDTSGAENAEPADGAADADADADMQLPAEAPDAAQPPD